MVPKHQTPKRCCCFDGHCLKEKECLVPFVKKNAFFLLRMSHLLFLLGTSGSFCKFNSFLFLFFKNLIKIFLNLFIRSLQSCIYTWLCKCKNCNLLSFLLWCGTRPYEWGAQWDLISHLVKAHWWLIKSMWDSDSTSVHGDLGLL